MGWYLNNLERSREQSRKRNAVPWSQTEMDLRYKVGEKEIEQARAWLAAGATRASICERLGISYRTLKRRLEGRSEADIARDNAKHREPYSQRDMSRSRERENTKNRIARREQ